MDGPLSKVLGALWVVHGYKIAIQDGGGRHFVFFDTA